MYQTVMRPAITWHSHSCAHTVIAAQLCAPRMVAGIMTDQDEPQGRVAQQLWHARRRWLRLCTCCRCWRGLRQWRGFPLGGRPAGGRCSGLLFNC